MRWLLLSGALLVAGCRQCVCYESSASAFQDCEIPWKGRNWDMLQPFFEAERRAHAPDVVIYRTAEPDWWRVWQWPDFVSHPRWDLPYRPAVR